MRTILGFLANHPLTRNQRIGAFARFGAWQVRSRLRRAPEVLQWVNGTRLIVRRGETSVTGNLYVHLMEFEEMAFLLHLLHSQDLFVDAGANSGAYTVLASAAVGARTIAFEPAPTSHERLLANIAENEIRDRVVAYRTALGATSGRLPFTTGEDATNHVIVDAEASRTDQVEVDVSPLDSVLGGETPVLLKIDVEGFELPFLRGAAATLSNPSLLAIIAEVNASGDRYRFPADAVAEHLATFGFAPRRYDPFSRTLGAAPPRAVGNVLFIRDETAVQERLTAAPPARLPDGRLL